MPKKEKEGTSENIYIKRNLRKKKIQCYEPSLDPDSKKQSCMRQ